MGGVKYMKEISEKLAHELLDRLEKLERFCGKKAKEGKTAKYDVDSDWMTASVMVFDAKQHLLWHMEKN